MPPDRKNPDREGRTKRRPLQEVIYEFIPVGNSVKVCAVDGVTGTEVSIVGPATASQRELERIALSKLRYVMGHEQPSSDQSSKSEKPSQKSDGPSTGSGKGWVV